MTYAAVRTVFIAFFALVLSAGHVACACLSQIAAAGHGDGQQPHLSHAEMAHAGHGASGERHVPDQNPQPHDDGHSGCEHCAASAAFKGSAKVQFIASPAPKPGAKAIAAVANQFAPAIGVPNAKPVAFRRRGPPGETPVTLKIRLLT